jgi:hypothetical protein
MILNIQLPHLGSFELRRGKQVSAKREPQNTESAGGGNAAGKENFIIGNSLFDIRYSNKL